MGKTIHLKGSSANSFIAMLMVDAEGEKAIEGTSGPMREAIQRELDRRCRACGSRPGQYHAPECPVVNAFTAGRIPQQEDTDSHGGES